MVAMAARGGGGDATVGGGGSRSFAADSSGDERRAAAACRTPLQNGLMVEIDESRLSRLDIVRLQNVTLRPTRLAKCNFEAVASEGLSPSFARLFCQRPISNNLCSASFHCKLSVLQK